MKTIRRDDAIKIAREIYKDLTNAFCAGINIHPCGEFVEIECRSCPSFAGCYYSMMLENIAKGSFGSFKVIDDVQTTERKLDRITAGQRGQKP